MTDQPKKYYVRFSNIDDHDKIMEFYQDYAHKNVFPRDESLIRQLADDGAITIIEDEQGKLVASTISYPYVSQDASGMGATKWTEVGTTRMVLNGYPGLFDVMITMQVLRAYLVEPPEALFIAQMDTTPVQNMAKKLGWRSWDEQKVPQELLDMKAHMLDPSGNRKSYPQNWFTAGPEALPVMAQLMCDAIDKPFLENQKTGEKISLDFSKSKFFALFEDEFRNLAERDLGNPDTPDADASIAKNRQKWMRWYFK